MVQSAKSNEDIVDKRGSGNFSSDSEKEIARLNKGLYTKKGHRHTEQKLTEAIYIELNQARKKRQISVSSMSRFLGVST